MNSQIIFKAYELYEHSIDDSNRRTNSYVMAKQPDGEFGYFNVNQFATTGSNTFSDTQFINANLIISGNITATNFITASTEYYTASTLHGSHIEDTHTFTGSVYIKGNETISGSLFISGTTELGGNIVPKSARGATLGTSDRPFSDIFVSSGSINIASDTPGDPNTTLSNIGGNILVSAGGMRLVGDASFIAATGSFGYISGSMTQVGNYTQTGNYLMTGNKTVSGSLEVSGSSKVNGYDVVTNNTNTFNPQFKDVNNTTAGIVTTASYTLMNNLCYFRVYVDFANCTNFGNSQYQITLPFTASHTFTTRDGHLHNTALDARYHIAGTHHAPDDGTTLKFYYFATTTDLAWKWNTPVSASSTSSHFDISGMYQIS